jgi:hypothetical protein
MAVIQQVLRRTTKGSKFIALACGLLLAAAGQAQTYSSSTVSYSPQNSYSSNQYNSQNNNAPYNHKPRYTGEGWGKHLVLEGGGGVTAAGGDTQNYADTGWNVLLGGGLKFNDRFSLLAEWNFNRMWVPQSLAIEAAQVPAGNEHIWTADLNPKFDIIHGSRTSVYAIGGGGFSRALTSFTYPVYVPCWWGYGYGYGYGGGCTGSVTVAHTSTNQANVDIGMGAEWRVSPYERGNIFLEARYLKLFSPRSILPPGQDATLIPITFGYRW